MLLLGVVGCQGGGVTSETWGMEGSTGSGSSGEQPSTGEEPTTGEPTTGTTGTSDASTGGETTGTGSTGEQTTGEPPALWSRNFGTVDERFNDQVVAVDSKGAVIVAGRFGGTVDFGGGPLTVSGGDDIYLVKFDGDGAHLWSKQFDVADEGEAGPIRLAVDPTDDSVLVGGSFSGGNLSLDEQVLPWAVGEVVIGDVAYASSDVFVARFAADGALKSARSFGDEGDEQLAAIGATADGVALAGQFTAPFELGGQLVSAGETDVFAARLAGDPTWSASFGTPGTDALLDAAVDPQGNLTLLGDSSGAIDLGGGPLVGDPDARVFVAQLDAAGDHRWSRRFDAGHEARAIAADVTGAVAIVGRRFYMENGTTFNLFAARLGADGTTAWNKHFGPEMWENSEPGGAAFDAAGNLVIAGRFQGAIDFGGGTLATTGEGDDDVFVALFDAAGVHVWSAKFGDDDSQEGTDVAADASGDHVLVTGRLRASADFGSGVLTSVGLWDMFVAEIAP